MAGERKNVDRNCLTREKFFFFFIKKKNFFFFRGTNFSDRRPPLSGSARCRRAVHGAHLWSK